MIGKKKNKLAPSTDLAGEKKTFQSNTRRNIKALKTGNGGIHPSFARKLDPRQEHSELTT